MVEASSDESFRRRGHLYLVADGMGAHAAGELASKLAADTIPLVYHKLIDRPPIEAIRQAVEDANAQIHHRGEANPDFHGMGTTSSVLLLLPEGAVVAQVGDSRVYRLRGDRLDQLSFDHSLVWEMMAGGKITEDEVPGYIPKNIITRSLGPSSEVKVDIEGPFPLQAGDTFLLCSDGLTGQVRDEELAVVLQNLEPDDAVRVLVDLANLAGGPDNITVIVVRVTEEMVRQASGSSRLAGNGQSAGRSRWALWLGWLTVLVLAMAAVGLTLAQQNLPAFLAASVAVVLVVFLLASNKSSAAPGAEAEPTRPGRSPYTTHVAKAERPFVEKLEALIKQLSEAASDNNWDIAWDHVDHHRRHADEATAAGDYRTAVRENCLAIRFLMQEIRQQKKKGESLPRDTS